MQRFMICYPKSLAGYRDINSPAILEEELEFYRKSIENLMYFSFKDEKVQLTFSEKAQIKFNFINSKLEKLHLDESKSSFIKQYIGKQSGSIARLAALLHVIEHLDDLQHSSLKISEEAVERAYLLNHYITANIEKAFGIIEGTQASQETTYVLNKLKVKYGHVTEVPYQKFWQDVSRKFKKSKVLRDTLKYLEEYNYVKVMKDPARRNKEIIYIHPQLVEIVTG